MNVVPTILKKKMAKNKCHLDRSTRPSRKAVVTGAVPSSPPPPVRDLFFVARRVQHFLTVVDFSSKFGWKFAKRGRLACSTLVLS